VDSLFIEWASRLIPGAKKEMIKGILIGRNFGNQIDKKNKLIEKINDLKDLYNLEAYVYYIKNNELKFQRLKK